MYFQELVERISPKLRKITIKLNGHLSTALAGSPTYLDDEDLFQEALLHLWVCLQKGKLESKTDSYILQGCYFHLKNYLRKVKKKIDLISLDSSLGQGDNVLERTLSLRNSESFFDDFKTERLIKEIRGNGFTKREKEILNLYSEGLTVREIGKKLGISHVMVVKLVKKIREKCIKLENNQ